MFSFWKSGEKETKKIRGGKNTGRSEEGDRRKQGARTAGKHVSRTGLLERNKGNTTGVKRRRWAPAEANNKVNTDKRRGE